MGGGGDDVLVDGGGAEAVATGPELRGRVDDAGGGPIPGASVRVKLDDRSWATTSGDDGVYVIRVPAATYVVEADADGYAPQEVQVEVLADTVQDFRLQPAGRVRGLVRRGGVAVEGATVSLLPRDDVMAGDAAPRTAITAADGAFVVDDVSPGGWIVLARHRGEVGVSRRLHGGAGPDRRRRDRRARRRGDGESARSSTRPARRWPAPW